MDAAFEDGTRFEHSLLVGPPGCGNCLEEQDIFTVGQLLQRTREELLKIPNIGEKTLETIYVALEEIGFYRASKQPVEQVTGPPARDFALLRG